VLWRALLQIVMSRGAGVELAEDPLPQPRRHGIEPQNGIKLLRARPRGGGSDDNLGFRVSDHFV
jgi:hypothetical protein